MLSIKNKRMERNAEALRQEKLDAITAGMKGFVRERETIERSDKNG
jgi:hypothetical protein